MIVVNRDDAYKQEEDYQPVPLTQVERNNLTQYTEPFRNVCSAAGFTCHRETHTKAGGM